MPKEDLRAVVKEMQAVQDHTGIVSLCTRALEQRGKLSREDRIFLLRMQATHLAAINPETWHRQIKSALKDALVEASGDPEMEAQLLRALTAADVPLRFPQEIEAHVRRFEALAERHPQVRHYGKDLYFNLGYSYEMARDYQSAEASYRRSLSVSLEVQAQREAGEALHNLAHVYVKTSRLDEAKAAATEAHELISPEYGGAKVICLQGKIARLEGDREAARTLFQEALCHQSADESTRVDILAAMADLELAGGNHRTAGELVKQGLLIAYRLPYSLGVEQLNELATNLGGDE